MTVLYNTSLNPTQYLNLTFTLQTNANQYLGVYRGKTHSKLIVNSENFTVI